MSVRLLFSAPLSTLVSGKPLNTKFFFNGCGFSQVPVFLICFFFFFLNEWAQKTQTSASDFLIYRFSLSLSPFFSPSLSPLSLMSFAFVLFWRVSPSTSQLICVAHGMQGCISMAINCQLPSARAFTWTRFEELWKICDCRSRAWSNKLVQLICKFDAGFVRSFKIHFNMANFL